MTTFFMALTLPSPRITATTTWATELNTAITAVDAHDHTSGSGQRLTSSSLTVVTDFSLGEYTLTGLGGLTAQNKASLYTTNLSASVKDGDLYFRDNSGNDVQITVSGALGGSGFGGVTGDYSSSGATAYYTDSTKIFTFEGSDSSLGNWLMEDLTAPTVAADSATLTTTTANSTAAFSTLVLAGAVTASGDVALNGNNAGRGIVPVGGVMGIASNITGVPSIPTGYAALDGSVVDDSGSPMDGVTLPDLSSSVFIMGSSTAGTLGGSATYSLVEAQLPSHNHDLTNDHADTFTLGNATVSNATHTHNIAHTHAFMTSDSTGVPNVDNYTLTSSDSSASSISYTDTKILNVLEDIVDGSPGDDYMARLASEEFYYTAGVDSPPTGAAGATAASATPSATSAMTVTGAVTSNNDNSGSVGSDSTLANTPAYISTIYIVRVK